MGYHTASITLLLWFTARERTGILYKQLNMEQHRRQTDRVRTRQAVDGILNAPANRGRIIQNAPRAASHHRRPVFRERVRTVQPTPRLIGDFAQTDGYHSSDRSTSGRVKNTESAHAQPVAHHAPKEDTYIRHQFSDESEPKRSRRRKPLASRRAKKSRASKRGRSGWKKFALRGAVASILLVVGVGGYLAANGYMNLNKIFQGGGAAVALDANVDPSTLRGEGDGRVNVLLLGRGGEGHDGADLTDTVILASIDPINKKAALVSLPRDLWVESDQGESKINAVFALTKNAALADDVEAAEAEKQGIKAVEEEVEEVTGVNIHYYGMIDFAGFEKAVNTVGGVTINVPEELRDSTMAWQNNWNPVLAKAGVQEMTGKQALMYVRSRHGSARGDFDRAERQRIFLTALKNEILSAGTYSNPVKVSRLMNDFGSHAKTDFSLNDLMRLYSLVGDISTFESISFVDEPHAYLTTGMHNGQSIVKPKAGVFEFDEMRTYLKSALPDGYIIKEKAPITVLNGTTKEGVATEQSDELKSYAYNVIATDNAPTQNYRKTVIVNLGGDNKYTQNYLEKRYGVVATKDLPADIQIPETKRTGFIVIIGQDEAFTR